MKTIVVYYSLEGNTKFAAEKIADRLGADLLQLDVKTPYPTKGLKKFFHGGRSAIRTEMPELKPYEFHPEDCGRIIIGFPVWASNVTPPIRTFIRDNDLSGKKIAAFTCMAGRGGEKALEKLKECLGIDALEKEMVLVDPAKRRSEDNERLIRNFCDDLV